MCVFGGILVRKVKVTLSLRDDRKLSRIAKEEGLRTII